MQSVDLPWFINQQNVLSMQNKRRKAVIKEILLEFFRVFLFLMISLVTYIAFYKPYN